MQNQLIAKYVLTKFLVLHTVRKIFETDEVGLKILRAPEKYVRDDEARAKFIEACRGIIADVVIDFDADASEFPENFDYRGQLRDKAYVSKAVAELVANYRKDIRKGKAQSLKDVLAAANL
jgi:hypothetical protein